MPKLRKRGKVFHSDLYIGPNNRVRKSLGTDERFAYTKLAELIKERDSAKYGSVVRDISWDAFKTRYMAFSATKKAGTHYLDRLAFRLLEQAFPLTRLESVNPERLEMFKAVLQKRGLHDATINRYLRSIKQALGKAIEWKLLERDDAYRRVKYFKEPKGRLYFWTLAEIQKILEVAPPFWKTVVMLGYHAGLRREEIQSLKVSCVDFERNRIHIEPTDDFTPKDYERRFIPMHDSLRAYLKEHLNGSEYALGDNRISPQSMTKQFRKVLKPTNLRGSVGTLRHSFASHCVMNGISLSVLKEWMGHSSIKTTMIYAHLSPEHLDAGINRMPAA